MSSPATKVTVIPGDGIGPEVVNAALRIIEAAGVSFEAEVCEAGAKAFQRGIESGVPQETIDSVERTRVVLKGPLETPIGYGNKSANVTLRKLFETYGNVLTCSAFLYGIAREELTGRELDTRDEAFPLVVAVRATRS